MTTVVDELAIRLSGRAPDPLQGAPVEDANDVGPALHAWLCAGPKVPYSPEGVATACAVFFELCPTALGERHTQSVSFEQVEGPQVAAVASNYEVAVTLWLTRWEDRGLFVFVSRFDRADG